MSFFVKRLVWMVLTLWIVFTVSFFLMRAVPGGPLDSERQLDPMVEANLLRRYNLDLPVHEQYLRELGRVVRFDLGVSFRLADSTVNEVIRQGFPVSAALGVFALLFALGLGLATGIVSAVWRQTPLDYGAMVLATVGIALPNFVLAMAGILLFAFYWPLLPAAGWGSLRHLVLPAMCLGAPYAAYIARLTRTGMLEVLSQDYIRTAYAKGLSPTTVIFRHALKGSLLPVVSFLGPAIAGILAGSLVIEQIFAIPGIGLHFIQAATQRDYTLAMGLVLLYTALLYSMNFLVDVTYALLDPRVKLE